MAKVVASTGRARDPHGGSVFKVGQLVYALAGYLVVVSVKEVQDGKVLYALAEQDGGAPIAHLTEDAIRPVRVFERS